MMTKLNQIVAIEKSVKSQSESEFTQIYHKLEKQPLFSGLTKTYQPATEEGEQLPNQSSKVQLTVEGLLEDLSKTLTRLFDVTATKDYANGDAVADVVVGGEVLLEKVPVTYLLFLEKKLTDLNTVVGSLPVLDPAEEWQADSATGGWRSKPEKTARTKKVQKPIVLYDATDKHPAQTQLVVEDVIDGYWTNTKFSGNVDANRKKEILDRVRTLQEAVKYAREAANGIDVVDRHVGAVIFNYIFAR